MWQLVCVARWVSGGQRQMISSICRLHKATCFLLCQPAASKPADMAGRQQTSRYQQPTIGSVLVTRNNCLRTHMRTHMRSCTRTCTRRCGQLLCLANSQHPTYPYGRADNDDYNVRVRLILHAIFCSWRNNSRLQRASCSTCLLSTVGVARGFSSTILRISPNEYNHFHNDAKLQTLEF